MQATNTALKLNRGKQQTSPLKKYNESIFTRLETNKAKLAVVGLGYVGLPIALEFANRYSVIGFDISEERVDMMRNCIDPSQELEKVDFLGKNINYTHKTENIADADFYVVAVPTPINQHREPELTPLKKATASVAKNLKSGDYVVFESTVYPGCTEEVCVPILERISGLTVNEDFKVGYSPERINPGDKVNTLTSITKVVSGSDEEALENIAKVYESIIDAGVHKASSMKVAEASKIVENTQRDVNIALMNELSLIFDKMDINTGEVLKAAGTKWNFLNFFPGLVGGHCIGVDPYYLAYKAEKLRVNPRVIRSSRAINDEMAYRIADQVAMKMNDVGTEISKAKVLIKGITFKEDVADIRNSKVADIHQRMSYFSNNIVVEDPHAEASEVMEEYGVEITPKAEGTFDAVIVAVAHKEYINLDTSYYNSISHANTVVYDVRNICKDKIEKGYYLSL